MATTTQDSKEVVRRSIEEAWNEEDIELVDELVAPDGVQHDPTLPDLPRGPDAMKQSIRLYHAAFPDATIEIEQMVAEDDTVAVRWIGRGTHEGELMGVEPTGNEVEVRGIQFSRVEDGKIAESWIVYDSLGMLQQVGAVPEQPAG